MTRVKIPVVDANVDAVTITQWLKTEGDTVRKGEPLVELTTEKACFELESPAAGVVRRILVPRQSVVPVGYVIALVGRPEDPLPDVSAHNARLMVRLRNAMMSGSSSKGDPANPPLSPATQSRPLDPPRSRTGGRSSRRMDAS